MPSSGRAREGLIAPSDGKNARAFKLSATSNLNLYAGLQWVMTIGRTIRFAPLLAPSVLLALLIALPNYSARLSLVFHGQPLARVVPKERLNVFEFVPTDSLRSEAIVFSAGKPVGWIYQPMAGFARFVKFSVNPNFEASEFDARFDLLLPTVWIWRWSLLPIQAAVLLVWIWRSKKRVG